MEKLKVSLDHFHLLGLNGGEKFYDVLSEVYGLCSLAQIKEMSVQQQFKLPAQFIVEFNNPKTKVVTLITPERNHINLHEDYTVSFSLDDSSQPATEEVLRVLQKLQELKDQFEFHTDNTQIINDDLHCDQGKVVEAEKFFGALRKSFEFRGELWDSIRLYKSQVL